MAAPLQDLLKKYSRWQWTSTHEEAFQKLKEQLKNVEVLAYLDESEEAGPLIVQTDSSDKAIGYTISQQSKDGSSEKLLGCYGRTLRNNEKNWTIAERECLGLLTAIIRNRHLLEGKPVIVRTDNITARYLQNIKSATTPRLIRWSIALDTLLQNAKFEHVKGALNIVPDALSRQTYTEEPILTQEEREIIDEEIAVNLITSCEANIEDVSQESDIHEVNTLLETLGHDCYELEQPDGNSDFLCMDRVIREPVMMILDQETSSDSEPQQENENARTGITRVRGR